MGLGHIVYTGCDYLGRTFTQDLMSPLIISDGISNRLLTYNWRISRAYLSDLYNTCKLPRKQDVGIKCGAITLTQILFPLTKEPFY